MKRQLLVQQILSIENITPYALSKKVHISRSTICRWLSGSTKMGDGSVYQLDYYLRGENNLVDKMLDSVISEIGNNRMSNKFKVWISEAKEINKNDEDVIKILEEMESDPCLNSILKGTLLTLKHLRG